MSASLGGVEGAERVAELRDQLGSIAESLADLAFSNLRAAVDADGPEEMARARAAERQLTRARNAVVKGQHLLDALVESP